MTELDRVLAAQRECRDYILEHKGEDVRGALLGIADNVMEECLILEETKPTKGPMTGAICPECKLHRGHRANCPIALRALYGNAPGVTDYSIDSYRDFLAGSGIAVSPLLGVACIGQ